MKLVQTIYTGHDWNSGEDDVDRCVKVALVNEEGKSIASVSFSEGEPEDMTLYRDLSDAYSIAELVKKVYELGREGIDVTFEDTTEEY